jgi:predicted  nucleic acid-binding Zn-ribbon protein
LDKLHELIIKVNKIKLENSDLQKDNDALYLRLEKKENELGFIKDKVKLMNISKSVDTGKEDVKATRLKINEYVREIDKCISLLNK